MPRAHRVSHHAQAPIMNGVLTHVAVTNSTAQTSHLGLATPRPTFPPSSICAPRNSRALAAVRAVNKLSSGAWNEKQASMKVGKAAGDLHTLQHPDLPVPSLRENSNVCVFLVAAADSEVLYLRTTGSDQASTESPADDEQLLFSSEQDSRLDAFALASSASASEP